MRFPHYSVPLFQKRKHEMGHNAVLIGGTGLVASVAAWLLCRLSGYTVGWPRSQFAPFVSGFTLSPRTPLGEGLEYPSYPTTCTVLTWRTVPSSPSSAATLNGCGGSVLPSRTTPSRNLKSVATRGG